MEKDLMPTLRDAREIADTIAKTTQPVSIIAFGFVAKNGTGKRDAERAVLAADNLFKNGP